MLRIRRVEERLLELFAAGRVNGTTHTSIGQESCAVGVMAGLDLSRDVVFSNHRCHGHFLAYGGTLDQLFGEVMGTERGVCLGIGGSQHLQWRNFYSNGVQGGIVPTAVGAALAEKSRLSGAIVTVFMGDGTFGEGAVYEAFNIAALWGLPVLFVVEANRYAQTTPTSRAAAGRLADRPRAFGIPTEELDVRGPAQVHTVAQQLAERVRTQSTPACLVLNTYRLGPHSKGDDFRPAQELLEARERDPLTCLMQRTPEVMLDEIDARIGVDIQSSVDRCAAAAPISFEQFLSIGEAPA
jgi:TPP-dependent pyruvate/acetoin dehydrogenase alpha subunit